MKEMTKKSLDEAFAGESMAHMKYLAFSLKAEKEGFANIARLFKAVAYAEMIHAHNHARNLGYIGKTAENLQSGIDGEDFEVEEMYPAYDAIAELQGEKGAKRSIYYAIEAEKTHSEFYKKAKADAEQGKDTELAAVHVCDICGYTVEGEAPDQCPICKAKKEMFTEFK